jgi:methionine-rich copper-binding protein CopC
MNRVALASSDAIGPGQQKTFTWTVIAPRLAGTYNFQWRMVQDGVAWFGPRSVDAAVTVQAASSLDAAFVGQSVPAVMTAGQSYTVSVTMRNTGGTTWTAGLSYGLGAQNPHDNFIWGMNRVALASTDAIGPGQQKTFTWTITAPLLAGTYDCEWRMVQDGVAWFGQSSPSARVSVSP